LLKTFGNPLNLCLRYNESGVGSAGARTFEVEGPNFKVERHSFLMTLALEKA